MPITKEQKAEFEKILSNLDSLELVKITSALYDSIVYAELPWQKLMTIANHIFAKVPWSRLPKQPEELGNAMVALVRSVEEHFIKSLAGMLTVVESTEIVPQTEPAPEQPAAATSTSDAVQITLPATAAPVTRSEIDDLDEDASMHGMDTESPPADGAQAAPAESDETAVETAGEEESASQEEDDEDDEEDEDEEPVQASASNGHSEAAPAEVPEPSTEKPAGEAQPS